jgi:signal transduction histidine kinase
MRSERDTLLSTPDAGESNERVTISQLPTSSEAVSGSRPALSEPPQLPPRWLEKLLALWSGLPVSSGDRSVVQAVVDALASMLPDHAVGACLVPSGGGAHEVIRAIGLADEARSDPTRIFSTMTYERVLEFEPGGSTLHVAAEDPTCEDERSLTGLALASGAHVARRGVELARMQSRANEAVTELRAMNAHMVQAEKLASLGQIAAGVVHELNNPLTSIVAYTDYLIRKVTARTPQDAGSADEIDRLKRIAESAGRMLRFTRDLVSYARPSSEAPVPISMHMVIDQAIAFCEHVIADAQVTVVRVFEPELGVVHGKPEQLAQIFVNLVTNACHAMAPGGGGTLTITTRDDESGIHVDLVDTGHGIQPDHLAHVFTPFFTTKTAGAGTGLGLAIVKSIVEGHAGSIHVRSDHGRGATFTLTLPASRRESRAPRPTTSDR